MYILAQIETDNSLLEELWINTKTNISQKLAIQETADKKEKTLEEMVPPELLNYKDVFDKVTAERFPESRPWDHAIDLRTHRLQSLSNDPPGTGRTGQIY